MSLGKLKHNWTDALIIYLAFFLRAFSFVFLIPIMTRVIDKDLWGNVLAAQSLAMWLIVIVDFGFTLSLTRKIAVNRENNEAVRDAVGDVYSAKIILILPMLFVALLAQGFTSLSAHPSFIWSALLWAISQGMSPFWYYQATERLTYFSKIEIMARIIYIFIVVLFIKSNDQAYLAILSQGLTVLAVCITTLTVLWREIHGFTISFSGGIRALREGATLSGFSILTSVYTSASTFIFSFFALAPAVAIYGNSDRLLRAGVGLLGPLNQLFLPRSSRAFKESVDAGLNLARRLLGAYLIIGIIGFITAWSAAPFAIDIILGNNYREVSNYLRMLLIIFPLTCVNTVLVYHIFIPLNREKYVTLIYTVASVISLICIPILSSKFSVTGMVASMIIPEVVALTLLLASLRRVIHHGRTSYGN